MYISIYILNNNKIADVKNNKIVLLVYNRYIHNIMKTVLEMYV